MVTELLMPAIVISALVAIVLVILYLERKRSKELAALALTMGFTFNPEGDDVLNQGLAPLRLFQWGHPGKPENVLRGSLGGLEVTLFDYSYTIGSGKGRRTFHQTACAFHLKDKSLPDFELRPENIFHKIGAVFGYQDIDFDNSPEFSKRYLLRTTSPDSVRVLFRSDSIQFFEREKGWSVEGGGSWFMVYQHNLRVKPENMRGFLETSYNILTKFK